VYLAQGCRLIQPLGCWINELNQSWHWYHDSGDILYKRRGDLNWWVVYHPSITRRETCQRLMHYNTGHSTPYPPNPGTALVTSLTRHPDGTIMSRPSHNPVPISWQAHSPLVWDNLPLMDAQCQEIAIELSH
jgi:hypothetical protein